jgi:hypothetical protein
MIFISRSGPGRTRISRAAVNPLHFAIRAARKPRAAVRGRPFDACVSPLEASGKTSLFCTTRSIRPSRPHARGLPWRATLGVVVRSVRVMWIGAEGVIMRLQCKAMALVLAILSQQASAEDAGASFLVKLFTSVCSPNVGHPEKVRAWALDKKLIEVTSPTALEVFIGPGGKGAAWAVPTSYGSFALSIRGTTEACAVYARNADPTEVESYFRKIMEGVARPGVTVTVAKDSTVSGASGTLRLLSYAVSDSDNPGPGFLYTLTTAEKPGGAFQASLQAARYSGSK